MAFVPKMKNGVAHFFHPRSSIKKWNTARRRSAAPAVKRTNVLVQSFLSIGKCGAEPALSPQMKIEKSCKKVAESDALQHPGDADPGEIEIRDQPEQHADRENEDAPPEDFEMQIAFPVPLLFLPGQRQGNRHSDDEHKKGKDEVCGGTTVPFSVAERRIDKLPAPGVIDQDHAGNGKT